MILQFAEATLQLVGDGSSTSFDFPLDLFGIRPLTILTATVTAAADNLEPPTVAAALSENALTLTFSTPLVAPTDGDDVYLVLVQYAY